jgi:hypothetical protein
MNTMPDMNDSYARKGNPIQTDMQTGIERRKT